MTQFHPATAAATSGRRPLFHRHWSSCLLCILLTSCGSMPLPSFFKNPAADTVIYALGPRDGYTSPISTSLKPACQALRFADDEFLLSQAHERPIRDLAKEMEKDKKARLLIAGYAPPSLPQEHARAISDRRALAVRQKFIELGIEPASLQTVGYGNDFSPSGPSSSVVVIYRQN